MIEERFGSDLVPGQVVISRAGHDKGELYVVTQVQERGAWLANGKNRTLAHPKFKNFRHLQRTNLLLKGRSFEEQPFEEQLMKERLFEKKPSKVLSAQEQLPKAQPMQEQVSGEWPRTGEDSGMITDERIAKALKSLDIK